MKLNHSGSNARFNMVLYLRLIILSVRDDIPVDSEMILMTDFVNLKIKLSQFFRCTHKNKMCVHMFIGVSNHMDMSICVYIKKIIIMSINTIVSTTFILPTLSWGGTTSQHSRVNSHVTICLALLRRPHTLTIL
jgi:hypothetical protein